MGTIILTMQCCHKPSICKKRNVCDSQLNKGAFICTCKERAPACLSLPLSAPSWRHFSKVEAFLLMGYLAGSLHKVLFFVFFFSVLEQTMLLLCQKIFFPRLKKKKEEKVYFPLVLNGPNSSSDRGWHSVCRWPGFLVQVQWQTLSCLYVELRSQSWPECGNGALTLPWCLNPSSVSPSAERHGWACRGQAPTVEPG